MTATPKYKPNWTTFEMEESVDGQYVLDVDYQQLETERAIMQDKLSAIIIVKGQCLACSPEVKAAYENLMLKTPTVKRKKKNLWSL